MRLTAAPRLRVNPLLLTAVKTSGIPVWRLAMACGCLPARISQQINAVAVADTPANVERFERLCDAIKFPRNQAFLDEPVSSSLNPAQQTVVNARREVERLERLATYLAVEAER
jgi:hypothetical protein